MKIIGITGYAQAGKDTLGKYIVENYGFTRYAFADALKKMALALNPMIAKDTDFPPGTFEGWVRLVTLVQGPMPENKNGLGWEKAKQLPEVRRFLQVLGTEGARGTFGDNCWVDALKVKIERDSSELIVITDVRFPNEAEWIHSQGGKIIQVQRINSDFTQYDNGVSVTHPSEQHIATLPTDASIVSVTMEGIYEQANLILPGWGEGLHRPRPHLLDRGKFWTGHSEEEN